MPSPVSKTLKADAARFPTDAEVSFVYMYKEGFGFTSMCVTKRLFKPNC